MMFPTFYRLKELSFTLDLLCEEDPPTDFFDSGGLEDGGFL
jgi:hypothetical protein